MLDATYLLAASIVRAKGSIHSAIHSGLAPVADGRHAASIISYVTRPKEQGIGLGEFLGPETMQFFVRGTCPMINAAVQRDVDGLAQGSHGVRILMAKALVR